MTILERLSNWIKSPKHLKTQRLRRAEWVRLDQVDIVRAFSFGASSLQMEAADWVEFAPLGTFGPIKMRGCVNPSFQYVVFEKHNMCFILVTVETAVPDKIHFFSQLLTPEDPKTDGDPIKVKEIYKEPFMRLSNHVSEYFPFCRTANSELGADSQGMTFNMHRGTEKGFRAYKREFQEERINEVRKDEPLGSLKEA